ncbi:Telomerase Cajal body protein 1 [Paragonimus westermani]|uniref:WD repeat-containing protein 79 n=1 Tax=Paragonimus westermani TaxID=34504 RepID=A0A8T0DC64_9TREM|nr:Telomerase Cajal body protein 1 [Paragonimus westermani]
MFSMNIDSDDTQVALDYPPSEEKIVDNSEFVFAVEPINNESNYTSVTQVVPLNSPTTADCCSSTVRDSHLSPKLITPVEAFNFLRSDDAHRSGDLGSLTTNTEKVRTSKHLHDHEIVQEPTVNISGNANANVTEHFMEPLEDSSQTVSYCVPDWLSRLPHLVAFAEKDYHLPKPSNSIENYLRGCLWSPDGSCILTNSRDNVLRLFNLPTVLLMTRSEPGGSEIEEMHAVLSMRENELVYDYAWYPKMHSSDPATCCFASTLRRNPIRLWDAFTGAIRATYRPINHMGELISAYSITFSSDGLRLYAGFNRFIHVFDVSRPGSDSTRRPKLGKKSLQGGIISCIATPREPVHQIYATGSYNGTVAVFSEPWNLIGRVFGSPAGVTQVQFSPRFAKETGAPWYLAAGGRMDSRIHVWDARRLSDPLMVLHRRVENHQRFQFDIDFSGQYLFTGNQTGMACVYDLAECMKQFSAGVEFAKPAAMWRAHADCAHGLSVHPSLPVVATTSGQRRIRPPVFGSMHSSTASLDRQLSVSSRASSSSDELTDSENELANLTDEEASVIPHHSDTNTTADRTAPLPLCGQLTRLPRENRLSLWAFATKEIA